VDISVDKSAAALKEGQKHVRDRAYITGWLKKKAFIFNYLRVILIFFLTDGH
jgi:hypothetical protein